MPESPPTADTALLHRLRRFLALEAPYLLGRFSEDQSPRELEELLVDRLRDRYRVDPHLDALEPTPGLEPTEMSSRAAGGLETLVRGFFRREEILASISNAERRRMLRTMLLTRAVDEHLKRAFEEKAVRWGDYPSPQKGFRSTGQEAIVGAALRLRRPPEHPSGPDYDGDVIAPLIRDLGALLMFDPDPLHPILVQYGKRGTPMEGRDLHVGDLDRGVLPPAAPLAIATQNLAGIAYGFELRNEDRVCVSFIGDGGASLGEWHETVNLAAVRKLNLIFVVQNNHWALGTHVREQTAVRRFADRAAGYGIPGITLFGNDPDEIAAGVAWAADRARAGNGPTLLELVTYRRAGHAHHDDDRYHGGPALPGYELEEERERWERLDPIHLYEQRLRDLRVLGDEEIRGLREEVEREVEEAAARAEAGPWPTPEDYRHRVYAPRTLPRPLAPADPDTREMSYDEAIREALTEMMEEDEEVFVLGEDIGGRYGGAFGVTRGLAKRFGDVRVFNTPLAESAIVSCGVGAALLGLRPVVEIQFADFLATGFNALVNNAAKIYWRWGRPVPLVVRLPFGGATGTGETLLGGGPFHSQCPEMWFYRTPGWKIVAPSDARDAKGLMVAAIRDPNPVIYLEAKGLYGFFRKDLRQEVPLGTEHETPLGKAAIRRPGTDVTLVTYGAMVWTALEAADELADAGIETEIVDLRTLWPLDWESIRDSVSRTHRVVILHEDTRRGGLGGELGGRIADELFYHLDAPVRRVTAPDTPVPYSPPLEHDFLPGRGEVVAEVEDLVRE